MFFFKPIHFRLPLVLAAWLALDLVSKADVPQIIQYQGRVAVEGVNFDSTLIGHSGVFRFALVNGDGTTTYWSNDGSSASGSEPIAGVSLSVKGGLYSVSLGDASDPLGMTPISPTVFANTDVRLRVWFDDGTHGSQLLTPDERITAVGYAMTAQNVPAGAIGTAQLASGAVQSDNIATGAVGNAQLANSGITIETGEGLTGGGTLALGGTITLENSGVTALVGGGGITVSSNNGSITLGSNATALNTPLTLVQRDEAGDFSAGNIHATSFVGSGSGLSEVPGALPWQIAADTIQQALPNTAYLATNSLPVTLTLPSAPAVGDIVRVNGAGLGGWAIIPSGGKTIVGFDASLGPVGSSGSGAAVQYIGNDQWLTMQDVLQAGTVSNAQLATGAVQNANIAEGTISNTKLANSSITINAGPGLAGGGSLALGGSLTINIPDGGIGPNQIAANAIQSTNIALGAINAPQLADGAALANLTDNGQSIPSFSSLNLLEIGSDFNKPSLVLDRGIPAKGRVTFQQNPIDPGWSALVMSVNANWSDITGYLKDDETKSSSILQMEHEFMDTDGHPKTEMNWTVVDHFGNARRLWSHLMFSDDYTNAICGYGAPVSITIPEFQQPGPLLRVEGFKGYGDGVQMLLQNSNIDSPSTATQIVFRGVGSNAGAEPFSTQWQLGTDCFWAGYNDFYIQDGKTSDIRLYFDAAGNVGFGTVTPSSKLDVAGVVNASGFTVDGSPLPNLAKQTESRFAAELRNYYAIPDTVAPFLTAASSRVAVGALIIKTMSLSPDKWKSKTVKLQMIIGVDGNSGGNLACRLSIAYRNTALDGSNSFGYNSGSADDSLNNANIAYSAPANANALLLIESPAITIPPDVTALSANIGLDRSDANTDTNMDAAYIIECRVIEQ